MADGLNEARGLRVLEIMNDYRTLQVQISGLLARPEANPPDPASFYLMGYTTFREVRIRVEDLNQSPDGQVTMQLGNAGQSDDDKTSLQRIILDASARRFRCHKLYLMAAAASRWVHLTKQVKESGRSVPLALRAVDQRLQQDLARLTDEHVFTDLRRKDVSQGIWVDEDPNLERMLAWIRRQS